MSADAAAPFERVRTIALTMPGVQTATRRDGAPGVTRDGRFMAALAVHPSAEAGTLVVRASTDLRDALLSDAPDTYYVTEHYAPHPVVLARLARLSSDALTDLLAVSWRLSHPSARRGAALQPREPQPVTSSNSGR